MKILFVCLGNIARSQMAEGYYNHFTNSGNASSAGVSRITPTGYAHPIKEVVQVMKEEGIDVSKNRVKSITKEMLEDNDKIFILCKRQKCPKFLLNSDKAVFLEVIDPFHTNLDNFRRVRDLIKEKFLSIL
jgi:arsenate reductase